MAPQEVVYKCQVEALTSWKSIVYTTATAPAGLQEQLNIESLSYTRVASNRVHDKCRRHEHEMFWYAMLALSYSGTKIRSHSFTIHLDTCKVSKQCFAVREDELCIRTAAARSHSPAPAPQTPGPWWNSPPFAANSLHNVRKAYT